MTLSEVLAEMRDVAGKDLLPRPAMTLRWAAALAKYEPLLKAAEAYSKVPHPEMSAVDAIAKAMGIEDYRDHSEAARSAWALHDATLALFASENPQDEKQRPQRPARSGLCCSGPGMSPWPCPVCGQGGK